MGQTVQFPQIAQRALARTIRRTHGFNQRAIAVLSALSYAPVLAKEHLAPIMTAENFAAQEAWSALHQLFRGFRLAATETKHLCLQKWEPKSKTWQVY